MRSLGKNIKQTKTFGKQGKWRGYSEVNRENYLNKTRKRYVRKAREQQKLCSVRNKQTKKYQKNKFGKLGKAHISKSRCDIYYVIVNCELLDCGVRKKENKQNKFDKQGNGWGYTVPGMHSSRWCNFFEPVYFLHRNEKNEG